MSQAGGSAGPLLGAVLAGGSSRRLGRDKAAERIGGQRMIDRVIAALEPHCEEVVVVSSRADTPSGAWRRISDARAEGGPLCGIEAALLHAKVAGHAGVVVLAVDLPLVDAEHVAALVDAYRTSTARHPVASTSSVPDGSPAAGPDACAVAAARTGAPDFEPLCAVYTTGCLPTVQQLLDEGERAAQALFRRVGGRRVGGIDGAGLNVNEECDLKAATEALESGA